MEAAVAPAAAAAEAIDDEAVLMGMGKVETGSEWEMFKENVRPLKRGRNISLLNQSLKAQIDPSLRSQLIQTRRRMIEAIDEYKGEDPLQPWLECIKWVQESFPTGGESSGLVVIYEQCVRTFWHDQRYKEDLRYLKIWLEYAENCGDAEVIYSFLEANEIGQNHAIFYSSFALHLESKNKLRKADDIFNLGIARKAKPVEKLESLYRSLLLRSTRKKQTNEEENSAIDNIPIRSFGTVRNASTVHTGNANLAKPKPKPLQRIDVNKPLAIYKDENSNSIAPNIRNQDKSKVLDRSWHTLGAKSDRNKENNPVPSKWVSYKVPQKTGGRAGPSTIACIEVYVDEGCKEGAPKAELKEETKSPKKALKLRKATSKHLKRETELLKENPLRNFPLHSLR